MAAGAWIGNFVGISHSGRNEAKGMAAHVLVGYGLFNFRHVAGDAFRTGAAGLVVSVLLKAGSVRAVRRFGTVALQTQDGGGLEQERRVAGAVCVMTTGTFYAMDVHDALHKIVALHPVLMGGAIGIVSERCFAELVFF